MKRIIFAVLFSVVVLAVRAQQVQENKPAGQKTSVLQLKESTYDFGTIQQSRPVTHVFEVVNTGITPLKLEKVQASCGCTTPEWSHDPIAPGATAPIKVGYNAYAEGNFTKTVTVFYNGDQTKLITITGHVYKAPPSSAPTNPSVTLLKQTNQ